MKFFLILTVLFAPNILSSQNIQVNNPVNLIENDDQQLIAINNQQKQSNVQNDFQGNKPSFNLPQQSKVKSESLQVKSRTSISGSSTGVSAKSSHHKTIKMVSSRGVVKHFDKKVKICHHYKKKNCIKKCASF
jgi:hypothetical protein